MFTLPRHALLPLAGLFLFTSTPGCVDLPLFSVVQVGFDGCNKVAEVYREESEGGDITLVETHACTAVDAEPGKYAQGVRDACAASVSLPPSCGGGDAGGDGSTGDVGGDTGPDAAPCQPGVGCDDGNACTEGDLCTAQGECVGVAKNCGDGITCSEDSCNTTTGVCEYDYGQCDCATDADCDDNVECTDDVCGDDRMCTKTIDTSNTCSDGDGCTEGDFCTGAGACQPGTPKVCDDGEFCTTDGCDSATGNCTTEPANEGLACDDGDPCTALDACSQGECSPGPPPTWLVELDPDHTVVDLVWDNGFIVLSQFFDDLSGDWLSRVAWLSPEGAVLSSHAFPTLAYPKALVLTSNGPVVVANTEPDVTLAWVSAEGAIVEQNTIPGAEAHDVTAAGAGVVVVGETGGNALAVAVDAQGVIWGGAQGPGRLEAIGAAPINGHMTVGVRDGMLWVQLFEFGGGALDAIELPLPGSNYAVSDLQLIDGNLALLGSWWSTFDGGNIVLQQFESHVLWLDQYGGVLGDVPVGESLFSYKGESLVPDTNGLYLTASVLTAPANVLASPYFTHLNDQDQVVWVSELDDYGVVAGGPVVAPNSGAPGFVVGTATGAFPDFTSALIKVDSEGNAACVKDGAP